MTNILLFYDSLEPTVFILEHTFKLFSKRYGCRLRCVLAKSLKNTDLEWCDVVISIRSQSDLGVSIAKIAKNMGRFYALMIDDDFFSLKDHKQRRPLQEKALLQMLKLSDAIMASNDILGNRMCQRGSVKRYVRVDTIVQKEEIHERSEKHPNNDTIKVVYYVNDGSREDFEKIIIPALPEIIEKYGERLQWTFLTVCPNLGELAEKLHTRYIPRLSLNEFRTFLREEEFSFGIAPLLKNNFTECKYINKFMEYSTAGIPCIYSEVEPYSSFIRDGENGVLCKNTPEEWKNAFSRMVNLEMQKYCTKNAQKQLRSEFSETAILERLVKDMPELLTYIAPSDVKARGLMWAHIRAFSISMADPFFKAWGRYRLEGFKSVCKWIWQYYIQRRR